MSTNILNITEGKNGDTSFTRFYGGKDHGVCLQITQTDGYIQLSVPEIIAMLPVIKEHILDVYFQSKLEECQKAIKEHKELEKTIVKDIREVSQMAISQQVLSMASLLSCKRPQTDNGEL